MAENLEQKKIFLIATGSNTLRKRMVEIIESHLTATTVFSAVDGSDAISKIQNVPPHVVLVDPNLSKQNGWQVVKHILDNRNWKETAIIILASAPEQERFTDEVVIGRVQYADPTAEMEIFRSFSKALNYVSHGEISDFYLRFLAPGDVLIREGEKAQFVYLVRRGTLRVYLRRESGEVNIGTIGEGEFVGEMSYINNEPRSADVIATTDCELIEIPINHLDQLLFQKPSWAKALMVTLSKRVKKANAMMQEKKSQSGRSKVGLLFSLSGVIVLFIVILLPPYLRGLL